MSTPSFNKVEKTSHRQRLEPSISSNYWAAFIRNRQNYNEQKGRLIVFNHSFNESSYLSFTIEMHNFTKHGPKGRHTSMAHYRYHEKWRI